MRVNYFQLTDGNNILEMLSNPFCNNTCDILDSETNDCPATIDYQQWQKSSGRGNTVSLRFLREYIIVKSVRLRDEN